MCVEMAIAADGTVHVRHSKDPEDALVFSMAEMRVFLEAVKSGEFDYLLGAYKGFGPADFRRFGPLPPIQPVPVDEPSPDEAVSLRRSQYRVC